MSTPGSKTGILPMLPGALLLLFAGCGPSPITGPTTSDDDDDVSLPAPVGPVAGEIAFATRRDGNWEVYVVGADGSHPVNMTNSPAVEWRPAWSPDGTRIAFERLEPDGALDSEIYVMNADGTGRVALAEGAQPAWSPDGDRIAFWRIREDDSFWGITTDIWVMGADGSNPTRVMTDGWYPRWSPDGTRIVYAASGLVKVMEADGSDAVLLATGTDPAWSPDGSKIAFSADYEGNQDIWVMDADGSDPVRLTEHPTDDVEPTWSPDGTRIAYVRSGGSRSQIYVMGADGSNPTAVTNESSCAEGQPSWRESR